MFCQKKGEKEPGRSPSQPSHLAFGPTSLFPRAQHSTAQHHPVHLLFSFFSLESLTRGPHPLGHVSVIKLQTEITHDDLASAVSSRTSIPAFKCLKTLDQASV